MSSSIQGWIFQGNPDKFDIDDYLSRYPLRTYWLNQGYYNDRISIGVRVFLWRAGGKGKAESGIIAIGEVVELPTPRKDVQYPVASSPTDVWRATPASPEESVVGIRLEELRLTDNEKMILRKEVKDNKNFIRHKLVTANTGTVFALDETQTRELERLWGLATVTSTPTSGATEGERRLRSHYLRERSTHLRKQKLSKFREQYGALHCELCAEKETGRYPQSVAERVFEIHHLVPLAKAEDKVKTSLKDLVVICANCHRAVHADKNVEENYQAMAEHFAMQN
jgi:hypothetical protein